MHYICFMSDHPSDISPLKADIQSTNAVGFWNETSVATTKPY